MTKFILSQKQIRVKQKYLTLLIFIVLFSVQLFPPAALAENPARTVQAFLPVRCGAVPLQPAGI